MKQSTSTEELDHAWCTYVDDVLKPEWASRKNDSYARIARFDHPALGFEKWLGEYGGSVMERGIHFRKMRYLKFADEKLSTFFKLRWL